jgi:hypothetical protein
MKSKMPEVVTFVLVLLALLIPPWKITMTVIEGVGIYQTEWALIFEGPSLPGQIDVVLLLIELFVIAGMYFLLRLILKPSNSRNQ